MTGRKVSVNGSAGLDTMSIRVSGNPSELEHGMQLAYLLLTEPKVEQAAFDQWAQATIQQIEGRKQQPQGVIGEVLMGSLVPEGEARVRLLETAQVETLTREVAQEWLERVILNSPIEVSTLHVPLRSPSAAGASVESAPVESAARTRNTPSIWDAMARPAEDRESDGASTMTEPAVLRSLFHHSGRVRNCTRWPLRSCSVRKRVTIRRVP